MKWFLLIFILGIGYAIISGNMGGARDAASNYNKLLGTKEVANPKYKKESYRDKN